MIETHIVDYNELDEFSEFIIDHITDIADLPI